MGKCDSAAKHRKKNAKKMKRLGMIKEGNQEKHEKIILNAQILKKSVSKKIIFDGFRKTPCCKILGNRKI